MHQRELSYILLLCGNCELIHIGGEKDWIYCKCIEEIKEDVTFDREGKFFSNDNAECVLFPSKDNRDWSTFKAPWKHKHFEPGQKILVPYCDGTIYKWRLTFYSHYDESSKHHMTTDAMCFPDEDVIAYKCNENKLGKTVK